MAYSAERFNENASGMTGRGAIAIYDGTGTDAEGGDTLAAIKTPGFFPMSRDGASTEVFDAVAIASRNPEAAGAGIAQTYALMAGAGLPLIIQARNGTEIDLLYHRVEAGPPVINRLEVRGGAWNHS